MHTPDTDGPTPLAQLARLFEQAVQTFGGGAEAEADALRWMDTPQWALGEATPRHHAQTPAGAREVAALLVRIDEAVLA
jgi:uncharacterized protein (DUF2384 family)